MGLQSEEKSAVTDKGKVATGSRAKAQLLEVYREWVKKELMVLLKLAFPIVSHPLLLYHLLFL